MAQARLNDQQAISTYVYAPTDYAGFVLPQQDQFTFFVSGGKQATFGMASQDLSQLMTYFASRFKRDMQDALARDETNGTKQLVEKVEKLAVSIREVKEKADAKIIFADSQSVAEMVIKTGHIPIMLEGIAPAAAYERAARTINAIDVSLYLNRTNSHDQAREYCVKQTMMQLVNNFRESVIRERNHLAPNSIPYVASNRLIKGLDEQVLQVNQRTMPSDFEQFDLLETFIRTLNGLICGLSRENPRISTLIDALIRAASSVGQGNTFEIQKEISNEMYRLMQDFVANKVGLNADQEMTIEQDNMLQEVLPLIAYLNSPRNPFARNGLFAQAPLTNPVHNQALQAYESHERSAQSYLHYSRMFAYVYTPREKVEFTESQIEQLLDGKKEAVRQRGLVQGLFGAIGAGVQALMIEGAEVNAAGGMAQVNQRRAMLALPMPPQHANVVLQITDGRELGNNNRPK